MDDHLKNAAVASTLSDEEITRAASVLLDEGKRTPFEQAILDEVILRKMQSEVSRSMTHASQMGLRNDETA